MENKYIEYNETLNKYFGHKSLKSEQFQIIKSIIEDKKDVCAILATGYGKSICYQLPFLLTKKCVVVISPLLSLMNDQKIEMEKLGIPVCCLNSDCKMSDKIKFCTELSAGAYKLVYMTPEYLANCEDFLTELYGANNISLVCIDEAHCISTWGNDFRASYKQLHVIKKWMPDVPVLAVTATASDKVRADICRLLLLKNPEIITGTFDRPNLYISVTPRKGNAKSEIIALLEKYKDQYCIIYCKTIADTEKIAEMITNTGIESHAYHAQLAGGDRDTIQRNFSSGKYKCIVATIAFGMGINVPNVRLVIHYGCPKNLESYYQEMGRAGRDGKHSECHLLYSPEDFQRNRLFINDIANIKHKEYLEQEIRNIEKYVYATICRRKILLGHFGQDMETCTNCDNCTKKFLSEKIDYTHQSFKLLKLIKILNGKFGIGTYINILRGSNAKNMTYHQALDVYGTGKDYTVDWWKDLVRLLINNDYIREVQISRSYGTTAECTKAAKEWISRMEKYHIDNPAPVPENDKLFFLVNKKNTAKPLVTKEPLPTSSSKAGTRWTTDLEDKILNDIKNKTSIKEIAIKYGRTSGAITSRLKLIACRLYNSGKPLLEISGITRLSQNTVKEILSQPKYNPAIQDNVKDTTDQDNESDQDNGDDQNPHDNDDSLADDTLKNLELDDPLIEELFQQMLPKKKKTIIVKGKPVKHIKS